MATTALLLGLLVVASVTDVRCHRIYNGTTYPGMLAALAWNAAGAALLSGSMVRRETLESLGWIGPWQSLLGLLVCGFVLLVCFVFLEVGGGDVKLMAMLGAHLGPDRGIEAMLWTFVLGGAMGLMVLIWRVGPWRLLARVMRQVLWTVRLGRWSPLTPEERAQLKPPLFLAPCALVAVVIVQFSLMDLF